MNGVGHPIKQNNLEISVEISLEKAPHIHVNLCSPNAIDTCTIMQNPLYVLKGPCMFELTKPKNIPPKSWSTQCW